MTGTDNATGTEHPARPAGSVSWLDPSGKPATLPPGRGPRRRVPHVLIGVLLVVVCVGGGIWWSDSAQGRSPVLVIARPVPVGHVLAPADLRSAEISVPAGVATVAADQDTIVVGRRMATSLAPGALLTPGSMATVAIPAPGQAITAVGLKPGQFPPELAAGIPVTAVVTAATTTATAGAGSTTPGQARPGSAWRATVVGVTGDGTDQTTVISLEMDATAATQLAQIPAGQVAVLMLPGGGG